MNSIDVSCSEEHMATLVGVQEVSSSVRQSHPLSSNPAYRLRLGEMWPRTLVAVGLGLSLLWTASLFWLLYEIV
jgi:hypothetical protein